MVINVWELWEQEWNNAYKFFNSKGNITTKARLKKKWHDDFMKMFKKIEQELKTK